MSASDAQPVGLRGHAALLAHVGLAEHAEGEAVPTGGWAQVPKRQPRRFPRHGRMPRHGGAASAPSCPCRFVSRT